MAPLTVLAHIHHPDGDILKPGSVQDEEFFLAFQTPEQIQQLIDCDALIWGDLGLDPDLAEQIVQIQAGDGAQAGDTPA